jgi:hypothetical protein
MFRRVLPILALLVAAQSVGAGRATLDKPVTISTVKADKKPLDGRVMAYDDDGFELAQGRGNKTVTVRWDELGAPGQFNVRSALLGPKATGEQWLELGRRLLEIEGGGPFADRAFARAVKLDPGLKADVESAKTAKPPAPVEKSKQTGANATAPGAPRDRDGDEDSDTQGAPGSMTGPQVVGRVDDRTWGALTDAEQAAEVARLKAFAEAAGKRLNKRLTLNETKYFLFYSDLSPKEAANWAGLLDRMYARLAELFGVKKEAVALGAPAGAGAGAGANLGAGTTAASGSGARGNSAGTRGPAAAGGAYTNVWYGKALVFVFEKADDYRQFQIRVHQTDPSTSAGMCHCFGDGKVHIAFYRQPDELTFAHVLVHESVHGFVHRFRAPPTVPSWANEGLAEVIADELVPQPGRTNQRDSRAREMLQQYGGMGGMLDAGHISGWQYPVAEALCAYMIRQNKRNYVDFIVGIKEGLSWEQSLEQRYKAPRARLVRAFGESLNLRALKD